MLLGGLGGGGDVGLSLILADSLNLWSHVKAVVSFHSCRGVRPRERLAGALYRVEPWSVASRRFFEDKLRAAGVALENVYIICAREPWHELVRAAEWLVERLEPGCWLASDIGGDGLLLGYETGLGSYRTDTAARAVLAWAAETHDLQAMLAVAAAGAEAGGAIPAWEALGNLAYLHAKGALLCSHTPTPEAAQRARALLEVASSGMLPLYLAALEGRRQVYIDTYIKRAINIDPWWKHTWLLDEKQHCKLSPLCTAAIGYGASAVKNWARHQPPPPTELAEIYTTLKRSRKSLEKAYRALASHIPACTPKHSHEYGPTG